MGKFRFFIALEADIHCLNLILFLLEELFVFMVNFNNCRELKLIVLDKLNIKQQIKGF